MPIRISTAEIARLDTERIDVNDDFPGTFGFVAHLDKNPGPDWATEFDVVYETANRPGKPPVIVRGDELAVFYLPLYEDELGDYLRFLTQAVAETNRSVEKRNSVLPDEEGDKEAFRERLRALAGEFPTSSVAANP